GVDFAVRARDAQVAGQGAVAAGDAAEVARVGRAQVSGYGRAKGGEEAVKPGVGVHAPGQAVLFDEGQNVTHPAAEFSERVSGGKVVAARCGEVLVDVVVVVQGHAQLLEVVGAVRAGRRLADLLDGGQQQSDEDGDDGDHHQQLDQREGGAA